MKFIDGELFYIISLSILFVISIVISFKSKAGKEIGGRFLMIYFWSLWYSLLLAFLVLYGYANYIPHLLRTGHLTTLLIVPASYMYVSLTLKPRGLKWSDLLHLVPAVIYIIDYLPFYFQPASVKLGLIESLSDAQIRIGYNEGWFMPQYGHYVIRYIQIMSYCTIQLLLLRKLTHDQEHPIVFDRSIFIKWLKFLVISECLFFILPAITWAGADSDIVAVFSNIAPLIVSLIQGFFLILSPEILYGTAAYFKLPDPVTHELVQKPIPGQAGEEGARIENIPDSELDKVEQELEAFMHFQKPYLKSRYKLLDLSNDTGIPVYKISAYVNRRKDLNFFGYLNQYRIAYCLEKFAAKEYTSKTLEALAEECGFQNRTTFIRVFKSVTGMNPTEYIRKG
jgi:AraC-like DNA-binding protein